MRLVPLVLAAVCALVLFGGLGRIGFVDRREARDAEVARELVERREALTPLLGDEPLFEKPILGYAPDLSARLLAGGAEVPSRLLRALLALLLVILTASAGAQHFGARAGWFSGLVLATSLAVPLAARTDGTQLLASLLGWAGCAGLADAIFGRRAGRGLRLVVAHGALAAALACAGPLPALWPLGGLALYLALARARDGWRRTRPVAGLALMAGLALPWYGAMVERHGAEFLARVAFFPYAIETRGPWYSGPVSVASFLVIGFFPWISLLPGAILHAATAWRRARGTLARPGPGAAEPPRADPVATERREEGAAHFFIACMLAALAPILVYPGPPLSAALPAMPAAALLCGRFLDHLFENPARVSAAVQRAVVMLAVFGSVSGVLLVLVAGRVPDAAPELRLLGSLVFLTAWAPFLANFRRRGPLAAVLMALPVALGTPVVTLRLLPAMEGFLNTRAAAEALAAVSPPRAPLVLVEPPPPSLRFYGRRNLVAGVPLASAMDAHRAADGLVYLAFRPGREREVAEAVRGPLEVLLRTPSLVLARAHP